MQDNDGERELVLGNKQLLAIFFAGTLLCGVFFAVGYVVGGNSVKSGANTSATNTDSTTTSTEGKREEPTASSSVPTDLTSAPADTGGMPSAEPHIRDNPASSAPAPASTPPAPPPVAAAPEPVKTPSAATYQTAPTPTAAAANSPTGVFLSVPEQGASYVQVSALKRPSADSLVKILRDGGLPAILATSSKPDLFEVLVGPYRTPLTLADAKRKLTDLSYGDLRVHKF